MAGADNIKGKGFKKGQSGNPNGRPKGIPNTKTRLLRILELTQKKKNPITGKDEAFSIAEQMDMAMIAKALKGDISAYREVIDRLEGKANQQLDITTDGEPMAAPPLIVYNTAPPLAGNESDVEKK
jgi:benzoyl-CoA reductase/2-hydroxyglutaryl-CoA dehydratase subunit BcrC/BadD/HgdB